MLLSWLCLLMMIKVWLSWGGGMFLMMLLSRVCCVVDRCW